MNNHKGITLTFGDGAENHAGMQMIGTISNNTNSYEYLKNLYENNDDYDKQFIDLSLNDENKACVLVINNFLENDILLFNKLTQLNWDKKFYSYGKVMNKKARYNLCFSDINQEPDYENKKGTILKWDNIPELIEIKNKISKLVLNDNLVGEGNYYYNDNCYIGWHGDAERKIVAGLRLGYSKPLLYKWFKNSKPINEKIYSIDIPSGGLYIMSEKAVGRDWKKRSIPTLRHAVNPKK